MKKHAIGIAMVWCVAMVVLGFGAALKASDERVAIKGYDAVAYFTESRPVKGDPRYRYEWDGGVYRFASQKHLELFKADPEKYAPVYRGYCTAALSRGLRVVADPENWIVHEGRLHIFGKPIGPGLMQKDAAGMKAKADANYPRVSELPEPQPQPQQPKQ